MLSRTALSFVSALSKRCFSFVSVLSQFCLSFGSALSQRCLSFVSALSQCCPEQLTAVSMSSQYILPVAFFQFLSHISFFFFFNAVEGACWSPATPSSILDSINNCATAAGLYPWFPGGGACWSPATSSPSSAAQTAGDH